MNNRVVDIGDFNRHFKKSLIPIIIVVLAIIVTLYKGTATVESGYVGVKLRFKAVTDEPPLEEGFHFIIPFINTVVMMDVREKKAQIDLEASSKDLQNIVSTIAVNYKIDKLNAHRVYQTVRQDYESILIVPSVQEVVKAVTAQFTAEELITKRQKVSNDIKQRLDERLKDDFILVLKIAIVDFKFSAQFRQAIEDKQIAEQQARKAKYELQRIKIEAEQQITKAKAEAESLRIQKENLSPDLLELRRIEATKMAIEKWDGKLPTITSETIPFIDVKGLKQ